jgi:LacI family transcriptional regulator
MAYVKSICRRGQFTCHYKLCNDTSVLYRKSCENDRPMNLQEVAILAKVSTATVSRVLNNVGPVKNSTRTRVLKAVAELKYHPNLHARNLAGGKSRTIGIIVSNMENPFFVDIYKAAEQAALSKGFDVVLANTDYDPEHLIHNIRLMIGRRVAGLALAVSEMDPTLIDELCDKNIRTVTYDAGLLRRNSSNIIVNYAKGIERIVSYLHELGHRRMAFISHHRSLRPLSFRERGFREAVERYSPVIEWRIVADVDGIDGGRNAVRAILASGFHPTAIICVNDVMAIGALHELREAGLRVPQDVSVTGFDNIKLAEIVNPSLTTLHIPRDRLGHLMMQHLMADDSGDEQFQPETVIDPEFVVRESTGGLNRK